MDKADATWRRPPGSSGPAQDPERDDRILHAAIELLGEGGFPALTMDKAAARAGVGKATVYRRWKSRLELAANALEHASLADTHRAITIGPGRLRQELVETLMQVTQCSNRQHSELVTTLLDMARQHPRLFALMRERYVDSMHREVVKVLAHAFERGDIPPLPLLEKPDGKPAVEISAAVALLIHWQTVRGDEEITEEHVCSIVDGILLPLASRPVTATCNSGQ
ncbi:TetR/AcrR family transcriptional regulator [Microbispora corallina]|uniref:TetR family transcriptional regulator n=2 Tax=Streptosporangiaceae TaxID=2004 RepID=A0A7C9N628_9ACTN|nr:MULTISPECIES: TetR/AcrR family transcriptional regulator [Streptosporangiaceae]NAS27390.1 TetR family transcriptional regulator [Herbidospora solisilvae]GIH38099.1 putative TetR-family transcriptional regulator [Microbispora corallina]